jgi:hypothetical protein
MAYFIDLFSPETYEVFAASPRNLSSFRLRHESLAKRVQIGDRFICYLTKLSCWFGVLEVMGQSFKDDTPLFYPIDDPLPVRFPVREIVWLPVEQAIPMRDERVWHSLSFTKHLAEGSSAWTGKVRSSLTRLDDKDGLLLEELLLSQMANQEEAN